MSIAKNYLNESELKKLNNLTNLFLDYAEDMAEEKAESEYEKFRIKQDKEYISSMDKMYKKYLEGEKSR